MNHIGNLKKTVEKVQTKEEAKDTIMKAGVLLKDEQLDLVAGGAECGANEGERENYLDDGAIAL